MPTPSITPELAAIVHGLTADAPLNRLVHRTFPGITFVADLDATLLACSPQYETLTGIAAANHVGGPLADLFAQHDGPELLESLKGPDSTTHSLRTLQGPSLAVRAYVSDVLEASGRLAGYLGYLQPIRSDETDHSDAQAYRETVKSTPLGVHFYQLMDDGRLIFSGGNPAADRILGVDHRQFVGRTIEDAFPALEQTEIPECYRRTARDGSPWMTERVNYADSRIRGAYEVHVFRTAPGRIMVLFSDITERKRAEIELREKTEQLEAFFNHTLGLLCIANFDGCFLRLNPEWSATLGYELSELEGRSVLEFVHPDDVAPTQDAIRGLGSGRPVVGFVNRCRHRDGSYRSIEWRSFSVGGLIFASALNITARLRTEAQLRDAIRLDEEALHVAQMGHWEFNLQTGLFRFNDQYYRLHGLTAAQAGGYEMSAAEFASKWVHPEDSHLVAKYIGQAVDTSDPDFQLQTEARLVHVDGVPRHVTVWFRIEKDGSGRTTQLHGVNQDITARRQIEREKESLQEQLLQSQKMESVGRLAGGVAHDFNNLLTVINGYSDLILHRARISSGIRDKVEQIKAAGERAASLTQQLLAFSRRQIMKPELLDVNAVVAASDRILRRLLGEDIEFVTVLTPSLGTILADPGHLGQVLLNLAVNARDAMPSGGKLIIETANADLDESYTGTHPEVVPGPYVVIAVSDTGCGMDEATRLKIFEPFFTTKPKDKGTGLGLSTVYGIVKQNQGSIWVYSEPNRGTTFRLYFPRTDERPQPRTAPPGPPRASTSTATILLVEDERIVREFAREVLRQAGYQVLEAVSGEDALSVADRTPEVIHLLLTDVVMPGLSGRGLANRLKESRPAMGVLYTSGYTENAIAHSGVLDPDVDYLSKPFSADALIAKVQEVLSRPEPGARRAHAG